MKFIICIGVGCDNKIFNTQEKARAFVGVSIGKMENLVETGHSFVASDGKNYCLDELLTIEDVENSSYHREKELSKQLELYKRLYAMMNSKCFDLERQLKELKGNVK